MTSARDQREDVHVLELARGPLRTLGSQRVTAACPSGRPAPPSPRGQWGPPEGLPLPAPPSLLALIFTSEPESKMDLGFPAVTIRKEVETQM